MTQRYDTTFESYGLVLALIAVSTGVYRPKREIESENLHHHYFTGFVVHGSNGESAMMDFQERLELIRVTKELVAKDKKLIVGVGKDCEFLFLPSRKMTRFAIC